MVERCPFSGSDCRKTECALWMRPQSICAQKYIALAIKVIVQNGDSIRKDIRDMSNDVRFIHDDYCGPTER